MKLESQPLPVREVISSNPNRVKLIEKEESQPLPVREVISRGRKDEIENNFSLNPSRSGRSFQVNALKEGEGDYHVSTPPGQGGHFKSHQSGPYQ